jgi:hypothetical protein
MRNLLGPEPLKRLWTTDTYPGRVFEAKMARNASCVVVSSGIVGGDQSRELLDVAKGTKLWSLSTGGAFSLDPLGKYLAIGQDSGGASLLSIPDCRMVDQLARFPKCLAPEAAFGSENGSSGGYALIRRHAKEPVVTIGSNREVSSIKNEFSADGRFIAWGNIDGTVSVCEIEKLRRELAAFGMAW